MENKTACLFLSGMLLLSLPAPGLGAEDGTPDAASPAPVTAPVSEPGKKPGPKTAAFSGIFGLSEKYDSNLPGPDGKAEGSAITELSAQLAYRRNWARTWNLEIDLLGLADWPARDADQSWYLGNANLFFGYRAGPQILSFLNEAKYLTGPRKTRMSLDNNFPGNGAIPPGNQPFFRNPPPPGDFTFAGIPGANDLTGFDLPQNDLDFLRNSSILWYRRTLSPLWRVGMGYENVINLYPDNHFYDFTLNGWFLEATNSWTPELSTHYSYTFQFSLGNLNPRQDQNPVASGLGYLHTAEVGADWFLSRRDSLNASYTFQLDDSSPQGVNEFVWFGDIGGSQNIRPRFTYYKHKGSLLYLHLFPYRITFSLYAELLRRSFSGLNIGFGPQKRNDIFLLSSFWLKVPIVRNIFGRARYTYRWDRASEPRQIFQDHIFQLGVEYQF